MKTYSISKHTIKNKTDGFYQVGKDVFIETDNNADAFGIFEAVCNFWGIDYADIEIITKDGDDIIEAKAYTSGSLGWNPDNYEEGEQPYGENGEPLMCFYFGKLASEGEL